MIDRTEKMRKLRARGLNDAEIGDVFGISRERVAQLIGRVRVSKEHKDIISRIVELGKQGVASQEIAELTGRYKSYNHIRKIVTQGGVDYRAAKNQRRINQFVDEIVELVRSGKLKGRVMHDGSYRPLNVGELKRFDATLYGRYSRLGTAKDLNALILQAMKK